MRAQSLRWLKTAILGLCNTRLFVQYTSWKHFYFSFFSGIWGNRGISRCPSWGVGTTNLSERHCPRWHFRCRTGHDPRRKKAASEAGRKQRLRPGCLSDITAWCWGPSLRIGTGSLLRGHTESLWMAGVWVLRVWQRWDISAGFCCFLFASVVLLMGTQSRTTGLGQEGERQLRLG